MQKLLVLLLITGHITSMLPNIISNCSGDCRVTMPNCLAYFAVEEDNFGSMRFFCAKCNESNKAWQDIYGIVVPPSNISNSFPRHTIPLCQTPIFVNETGIKETYFPFCATLVNKTVEDQASITFYCMSCTGGYESDKSGVSLSLKDHRAKNYAPLGLTSICTKIKIASIIACVAVWMTAFMYS